MSIPRFHLAAAVLACALMAAKGRQPASSAVVNGLQMSVSHDDAALVSDKALQFAVKFYNTRSQKIIVTPGTTYNCGHEGSKTDLVKVNLTEASGAPHRHLGFLGRGPPYQGLGACAGRIDFFEVTLSPGESITLLLELTKYLDLSNSKQYDQAHFHGGTYALQMELTGPPIRYVDGRPTPQQQSRQEMHRAGCGRRRSPELFLSQGGQRINPRGAPSRNVAGPESGSQKNKGDTHECSHVHGADVV
jgi:hypothetical protein